MLGRTDRRIRILVLLVLLVGFALAAAGRLAYWQITRGAELRDDARAQLERSFEQPAVRGDILDRNGRILATTTFRDGLAAYPKQIGTDQRLAVVVDALAPILHLDGAGRRDLTTRLDLKAEYAIISRQLTPAQSDQVRAAIAADPRGLDALVLEPHPVRIYPATGGSPGTTLASQLLGFVSADGIGRYGIEQQFDTQLAGKPKVVAALADPQGRPLDSTAVIKDAGADGIDVRLTIDASLQLQLENELYAAWVADKAKRVSALLMDPRDGSILAWATVPGYDANDYARIASTQPDLLQDPIASHVYEPGSVMKMFTAAAAIDAGVETPASKVRDMYALQLGPDTIHNADRKSMGWLKFQDAIAYSRNVATARVAFKLDKTLDKSALRLYRMWGRFGIGTRTGIDVTGESPGIAADPRTTQWHPIDLANRAFGQGVAVTPIQLGVAYTAMINGGLKVQPHFLAAIGDQARTPTEPQRIISGSLARQLSGILDHVTGAVPWYAAGTLIHRYEVGGKTGTAQVWDPIAGQFTPDIFNFTFVGYVGGDRPEAVAVVRIQEARPKIEGPGNLILGITSYQLFHRIAVDAIQALDIAPATSPDAGYPEAGSAAEKYLYPERAAARQAHRGPGP